MPKARTAVVATLALIFQAVAGASVQHYGFYSVFDMTRSQDYLAEVQAKSNIINWVFDNDTLSTDFPQRIAQAPRTKLVLTLPLSTSTDYRLGINKDVFLNTSSARTNYLDYLHTQLTSTTRPVLDSVAYISLAEEWYTLMYQGYFGPWWSVGNQPGLNWQLFDNLDNWQKRDSMKAYLDAFIADVHSHFPGIPVVLVDNWWSTSQYNLYNAPANVDVLALDAYFIPTSSTCDATQRARFDDQVTAAYTDAGGYGKPLMMVANATPWHGPIPSTCQLQWFKDLADSRGDVHAILWWLYGTIDAQVGVREFPTEKDFLFQIGEGVLENNVTVVIDTPLSESTVSVGTNVGGWSIDASALHAAGIDSLHFYAYPDPFGGPSPIFLGTANDSVNRPDIASIFGAQFASAGYNFSLPSQTPLGGFTLVVFPHSSETGSFAFSRVATRHLTRQ